MVNVTSPNSPYLHKNENEVQRIALCHLESLTCLPALNRLFGEFGDRIGLVVVSQRFGSSQGGFFKQLVTSVRKSGVRMTFWLGFDLISAEVVGAIARFVPVGGSGRLHTLPALARRHRATVIGTPDINAPAMRERLEEYAPDLLLVMNFDQILQPPVIALPRLGAVNIHPSLLPDLRGPCPVFWALAEGRGTSGATVHVIDDARIDAGPILAQAECAIDARRSVAEINTGLFLNGVAILSAALAGAAPQRERGRVQDVSAGSYRGFPRRAEVAAARRAGVRLCSISHAVRLIASAFGIGKIA